MPEFEQTNTEDHHDSASQHLSQVSARQTTVGILFRGLTKVICCHNSHETKKVGAIVAEFLATGTFNHPTKKKGTQGLDDFQQLLQSRGDKLLSKLRFEWISR